MKVLTMKGVIQASGALFLFIINSLSLSCQSSSLAAGGNASGPGGSASYSVGQVVYNSVQGSDAFIIQGVQQPWEVSILTGAEKGKQYGIDCYIYPNPASDYVILKIASGDISGFTYSLSDIGGRNLLRDKIISVETRISLSGLYSSIYFLKVFNKKKEIITFKIIKTS